MLRLDHVLFLTPDLPRTTAFLSAATGLSLGLRPAFRFPGAWLYAGDKPVLHVAAVDPASADYLGGQGGSIDHIAFAGDDLAALRARIASSGLAHFERVVPESGERQVFVTGPGGLKLEFLFPSRSAT
ncbi:MAG: VOC family protein [Proteobacteria bacterium]|nr:VOC family protein [Pseudomonadota bacterium]